MNDKKREPQLISFTQKNCHEKTKKVCKDETYYTCADDKSDDNQECLTRKSSRKCDWVWRTAGVDVEVLEYICKEFLPRSKKCEQKQKKKESCKKVKR